MTHQATDVKSDNEGMSSYEFLVNHINEDKEVINNAVSGIIKTDTSGQFSASAARFLAAVDHDSFSEEIDRLLKSTIEKDRDKHYLPDLLQGIWGNDYMARAEELRETDDNFRRIYKRVHPAGII